MDLLNVSANERLDLADLTYAIFDSQLGLHRQIVNNVVMDPAGTQTGYILSGFGLTNPAGNQLTVTRGVALLPYRSGSAVQFGLVSSEGSSAQTLDLSSRAAGTYNVYITFTYTPDSFDTRTLWSPDNGGREYAKSVPTRQVAGWQLVVESVTPGAEYLQIGTVTLPGMAIVDQRPLLFEGRPDQAFVSAWGSGTNDRSTSRGTYPVTNLATFVAAVQQCLVDIKGSGIAKWYTPYIAGQTIGFQGTPKAASTAWFDANFYIQGDANNPRTIYSSDGANLAYLRGSTCFAVQGGSGSAASTLNFVLPSSTVGTKGPYSLAASASSFALTDTANALNPIVYTPANETLDLSGAGKGTVILPPAAQITYAAPVTVTNNLSILEARIVTGLMFYAQGATTTSGSTTLPTITGLPCFGFAANTTQTTFVIPIRLPDTCTITQIEYGYNLTNGSVTAYGILMRKPNVSSTFTTTGNPATPVSTTTLPAVAGAAPSSGGISSGLQQYHFVYTQVALSIAVKPTDTYSYFLQIDLNTSASASSTADTATTASLFLDYVRLSYTVAGPSLGGVR